MHRMHEDAVANAESDPLNYGMSLEGWVYADAMLDLYDTLMIFGGNRSSKTEYGARTVVKAALANPDSIIVCFAQDSDASIRTQQTAIWRYLPPEVKENKKKSETEYINYKVKTGFSGQSLILPNGSQILFHTYSQFIANRSKFEGLELGSKFPTWHNIGLWPDEYLEDGDLIRTMRFRLVTRDAKMVLTFTPIDGHTAFVEEFLKGAETTKERAAPLLDGEMVPVTQYSPNKEAGIVYFHSEFNPFGGYNRIAKELKNSSKDEIRTRAYGIPVKSMTALFPLFTESVHVVDELPKITKATHTVYQIIDPAHARNFAVIWAAVDKVGQITVIKEWPDHENYGDWAERGDPNWKHGPASDKSGYAVKTDVKKYSYVELFKDIEREMGVEVFERIGDSRFMAVETTDQDMFSDFSDKDMHVIPSSGKDEKTGIQLLDQWFVYNPNIEIDSINRPKMRFHKSCRNAINSVLNYGALGKKDEALKDWVDCLRYLRTANGGEGPEHYTKDMFEQEEGWGGY